ncbi:MAG: hypothetical protein Q9168_006426 [Polycauliona sp. 1 TL-2023]
MFQTSHPYSSYHAAARCISGGPIYITDTPGQHSLPLIHAMTAKTTQGTTRILRPNSVGKCIEAGVYIPYEALRFLKVGTYHTGASASYGISILAIFNVSEQPLSELIPLRDFDGVGDAGDEKRWIVRAYPSGRISQPMALSSEVPVVEMGLEMKGWGILTAYPLISLDTGVGKIDAAVFDITDDAVEKKEKAVEKEKKQKEKQKEKTKKTDIAILGLLGKMTGAAAVVGTPAIEIRENGSLRIEVTLKALGVLGIYISPPPPSSSSSLHDHTIVLIHNQPVPAHTVTISTESERVIEIDIETAWREMGLQAGWGNEVVLEVVVV